MKTKLFLMTFMSCIVLSFSAMAQGNSSGRQTFNPKRDFLLLHCDCKTDVDDVHTMAALATLLAYPDFKKVNAHVVTGTYGTQDGLYVPPNNVLELAFKANWSDAHADFDVAVGQVTKLAAKSLKKKGHVWIADAGQSDFTATVVKALKADYPEIDTKTRITVVQHSNWNEEVTTPELLQYVKDETDYRKIPDGNAVGNGTPGFRTPGYDLWKEKVTDPKQKAIWQLAVDVANRYNAADGRYHNEAVSAGGLDFSDLSEVCWILGISKIKDTAEFFDLYAR
ncbi:hypothetical protein BA6E_10282 [Bacteroidales bacterium 6E]|nr:hypothetical protein BA6E_10282 [Bacteroidales bacterium 6E]